MELQSNEYLKDLKVQAILEGSEEQIKDLKMHPFKTETENKILNEINARVHLTYYKCKQVMQVDLFALAKWYLEQYGEQSQDVINRALAIFVQDQAQRKIQLMSISDKPTAQKYHYIFATAMVRSRKTKLLRILAKGFYYTTEETMQIMTDRLIASLEKENGPGVTVRCRIFDLKGLKVKDLEGSNVTVSTELIGEVALELYGEHNLDIMQKQLQELSEKSMLEVIEFEGEQNEKRKHYFPVIFLSHDDPELN